MTTVLSPIAASRLETASTDNGYDHGLERDHNWLALAGTEFPLRMRLDQLFTDAPREQLS